MASIDHIGIEATARWTDASTACYKRGCRCAGCFYQRYFDYYYNKNICKMKSVVIALVRRLGTPNNPVLTPDKSIPKRRKNTFFLLVNYIIENNLKTFLSTEMPNSIMSRNSINLQLKELEARELIILKCNTGKKRMFTANLKKLREAI